MKWEKAEDISKEIRLIVKKLNFNHIDVSKIICFRSYGSTARARARIWSFPRVWQLALMLPPYYIIEVISKNFDGLDPDSRKKVLIHELLHIPKNFSGSLVPHRTKYSRINSRTVNKWFKLLKKS